MRFHLTSADAALLLYLMHQLLLEDEAFYISMILLILLHTSAEHKTQIAASILEKSE